MNYVKLKRLLFGDPISSHAEENEKLNVPLGLAVFAADALSSTAYATDEILLALVGSAYALQTGVISLQVAIAIAILIALVVISYRQIIRAYPQGGGAYNVAKQNLGTTPSHLAAAALLIDYILTVSVSITSGVAAITSTGLIPQTETTFVSVLCALFIMYVNLRGLKEAGKAFAIPAYTFLFSMALLIGMGLWRVFAGQVLVNPATALVPPVMHSHTGQMMMSLGFVLIFLKAFSHGCAGLTGIEAVSNGVKAFKQPAEKRANTTMTLMGLLLASIFLGITFLAFVYHILPNDNETIISQVAHAVFGKGALWQNIFYLLVQFSTLILLILAANTAFADFPRVASLLADDGYLPRQLMSMGDRLVFNNGIMVLGCLSIFLIIVFKGSTHALIPLYAVGVFISFTLAQGGMVVHHLRVREKGWAWGLFVNGFGSLVTAIVTFILAIEKFAEGAWIILIAIPCFILLFRTIKSHYRSIAKQLVLPEEGSYCPIAVERHTALVLVSSLNQGTIPALEYAQTISDKVEAVHVQVNPDATERLKQTWEKWKCHESIKLTILESPYRSLIEPLIDYITEVETGSRREIVTIIIPEFVTKRWWHMFLHNQSAILIKTLLRQRKGKVVTTVRYYLDQ